MNKTGDAKNSSRLKKRLLKRLATQLSIFTVATISAFMMFFFVSRFLLICEKPRKKLYFCRFDCVTSWRIGYFT